MLHHFIKGGSTSRDQANPNQSMKQSAGNGRHARLYRTKIVSTPRRHDDQRSHAQLDQLGIVLRERQDAIARNRQRLGDGTHAATGFPAPSITPSRSAAGMLRLT